MAVTDFDTEAVEGIDQDIDNEMSLLGSLFFDMHATPTVARIVEPDDFLVPEHRPIYEAMVRLGERDLPITFESVAAEIHGNVPALENNALYVRMCSLALKVGGIGLSVYYAEKVRDAGIARYRNDGLHRASELPAERYRAEVDRVLAYIERRLAPPVEWHDQMGQWQQTYNVLTGPADTDAAAIQTGIPEMDFRLGGLWRGDLIVFAAFSGVGKTSLATNIARHVAFRLRLPVAFFSLEMGDDQIRKKLLSLQGSISWDRLNSHILDDDELRRLNDAVGVASDSPLVIVSSGDENPITPGPLTVEAISLVAADIEQRMGRLGLIIVDHLHICSTSKKVENRTTELTHISAVLRQLALTRKCPVIALSQLSDEGKLRDSRMIDANAVVVMKMAPDPDNPSQMRCHVEKNRFGPTATFNLQFYGPTQEFRSLTHRTDILGRPA